MITGLLGWAYGVVPSYGPAIVLASAVIGLVLAPLVVLEVRSQWKIAARSVARHPDLGPDRDLFRGPHLALMVVRRVVLLVAAVGVLLAVLELARTRGSLDFAGVDLGTSALAVATAHGTSAALPHLVLPLLLVLVHAVAGTRPAGGRTVHLVALSVVAGVVPGGVVLYLLTVLLVNIGLVRLMARRVRQASPEGFRLPADRRRAGLATLYGGWAWCLLGVAWVVVGLHSIVTALPLDPRDVSAEVAYPGLLFELLGMLLYRRGVKHRWMGQLLLSRAHAYRYEHGFRPSRESLPALNRSLPGQSRRTGIWWMAAGGLGACGLGYTGITIGLRYGWELVAGGRVTPWEVAVPLGMGLVLMAEGNFLLRAGVRHLQPVVSSPGDLVPGSYALYLRAFEEDPKLSRLHRVFRPSALVRAVFTAGEPQEEQLADALTWAGLPVSVGRPGERVPHVGTARVYLPLHGWQEPVGKLMRGASLVVLTLGRGPGIVWELGEAMRVLPPQRLVLLVTLPEHEYDRCRAEVATELRGVGREPPALPEYAGSGMSASTIRGVIHFTPAWEAVFTPLERPPILENPLMGALDRSLWPAVVQLTDHERRTGRRFG